MRSTGLVRRLALFAAVFVLAGCESAPRAPLMSPYSDEIGFGYSERELSDRRFEVRYLTPTTRTLLNPDKRESEAEETRERSYDLALWRAAELVLEKGFAAFAVTTSRTDVEVEIVEEVPYFFDYGLVHPFSIRPLGGYRSFDYYGASIRLGVAHGAGAAGDRHRGAEGHSRRRRHRRQAQGQVPRGLASRRVLGPSADLYSPLMRLRRCWRA